MTSTTTHSNETLGTLFLQTEREHPRKAALLRLRPGGEPVPMPDWRLDRHIVRIGLYLRERAGVRPGDVVALIGPITHAWIVVDWAVVAQGATLVVIGPDPNEAVLDLAWSRFSPRAIFVAGEEARRRVRARAGDASVIALDGEASEDVPNFDKVLDLGGTLDTAERAGAFRDHARAIAPSAVAIAHVGHVMNGAPSCEALTHAEVMAKRQRTMAKYERGGGKIAYVRPDALSPDAHVALYALMGDGVTSMAIGTVGHELEEIARLGPGMVVTRSGVVAADAKRSSNGAGRFKGWLERTLGAGLGGSTR